MIFECTAQDCLREADYVMKRRDNSGEMAVRIWEEKGSWGQVERLDKNNKVVTLISRRKKGWREGDECQRDDV